MKLETKSSVPGEGQDKKLLAWLTSMGPQPVNAKEKARMAAAIEFDLTHRCVYLGCTVEQRMKTFRNFGYLYDEGE